MKSFIIALTMVFASAIAFATVNAEVSVISSVEVELCDKHGPSTDAPAKAEEGEKKKCSSECKKECCKKKSCDKKSDAEKAKCAKEKGKKGCCAKDKKAE